MDNAVTNVNDFKVVSFHNREDFDFLPEQGCMFDGRPISGKSGFGIAAGETITLPYHVAHLLAQNLAKYVLTRTSAKEHKLDALGNPIIAAIWDTARLEQIKNSYLEELYVEERPVALTETDRLMAKVEEYKQMVDALINKDKEPEDAVIAPPAPASDGTYKDKAEVIAELEKRGIPHDKRKNKAELEKLLA